LRTLELAGRVPASGGRAGGRGAWLGFGFYDALDVKFVQQTVNDRHEKKTDRREQNDPAVERIKTDKDPATVRPLEIDGKLSGEMH